MLQCLVLTALVLFSSCNSNAVSQETITIEQLFPLVVGNVWVYSSNEGVLNMKTTDRVDSIETSNNINKFVVISQKRSQSKEKNAHLFDNDATLKYYKIDGELRYSSNSISVFGNAVNNEGIILKEPIQKGTNWTDYVKNQNIYYEIININETVKINNKEYKNCVVVERKNTVRMKNPKDNFETISYLYYCPNIGLIKDETKGLKFPTILEHYDLKPAGKTEFKNIPKKSSNTDEKDNERKIIEIIEGIELQPENAFRSYDNTHSLRFGAGQVLYNPAQKQIVINRKLYNSQDKNTPHDIIFQLNTDYRTICNRIGFLYSKNLIDAITIECQITPYNYILLTLSREECESFERKLESKNGESNMLNLYYEWLQDNIHIMTRFQTR